MKKVLISVAMAIACGTAFAQTAQNKGVDSSSQPAAAKNDAALDMKTDKRAANKPNASVSTNAVASNPETKTAQMTDNDLALQAKVDARNGKMLAAMDTNGDGMISRAEWDAYHGKTWKGMKQSKGMVRREDMDMALKSAY